MSLSTASRKHRFGITKAAYHPGNDPPERPASYIVRYLIGEPRILNPIFAYSWFNFYFGELILGCIFRRNSELEFESSPGRVERHEMSDDNLVWTIHLTPGQTCHDDRPLTAHDIRFSWEVFRDNQMPAGIFLFNPGQAAWWYPKKSQRR